MMSPLPMFILFSKIIKIEFKKGFQSMMNFIKMVLFSVPRTLFGNFGLLLCPWQKKDLSPQLLTWLVDIWCVFSI